LDNFLIARFECCREVLRSSQRSSDWCTAHAVSSAAERMFEQGRPQNLSGTWRSKSKFRKCYECDTFCVTHYKNGEPIFGAILLPLIGFLGSMPYRHFFKVYGSERSKRSFEDLDFSLSHFSPIASKMLCLSRRNKSCGGKVNVLLKPF
jgi:hypothetical protein